MKAKHIFVHSVADSFSFMHER